jgi:iron complex transport system substrate-binding protein
MVKTVFRQDYRIYICLALALVCVSCSGKSAEQSAPSRIPQRIVSISPNVTEILYGVGAWSQVVAVSQFCSFPDDVKNKPRVSGWDNTNLEQLTGLKPDLVIGIDAQAPFVKDKLDALGTRSLFLDGQTLSDVYASIEEIGRATGHAQQAAELLTETQHELEAVRNSIAGRQKVRVLCVVDRIPGTIRELYTATNGTFLAELIAIAGGESIAPAGDQRWGQITKEAIVSLNPEVIIDMIQDSKGNFGEDPVAVWRELPEVSAVQKQRIYPVRDALVIHPSQFVGHTAEVFARMIHPEAFRDGP